MIKFFENRFSIEDGGYSGNKRKVKSGGYGKAMLLGGGTGAGIGALAGLGTPTTGVSALIGGGIGAGLGAWFNWLANIADKSEFNTSAARSCSSYKIIQAIEDEYSNDDPDLSENTVTTSTVSSKGNVVTSSSRVLNKKKDNVSPKGLLYTIDENPRKHLISMMLQGNVLVIYLNELNKRELSIVNEILDDYCFSYRNADYSSQQCGKNSYVIDLKILDNLEAIVPLTLMESGLKINILTSRSRK